MLLVVQDYEERSEQDSDTESGRFKLFYFFKWCENWIETFI